ncbi:hypothetical protein DFQ26_009633 [Actinomortierella ambigua]|nr:hypothetical protein DFQ26_009633 [Actinomortierella ambigua]
MTPFPLQNKQAAALVNGKHTEVLVTAFSDKILILVSQYGKVGSLLHTTVDNPQEMQRPQTTYSPYDPAYSEERDGSNLRLATTNTTFLLGAGSSTSKKAQLYQVYTSHVAQMIVHQNPQETRSIVFSLALDVPEPVDTQDAGAYEAQRQKDKTLFEEVVRLVNQCRVW